MERTFHCPSLMRPLFFFTLRVLIFAGFMALGALAGQAAQAAGCGKGCQKAMGSCRVNSSLWDAAMTARQKGVRVTSCCRSPAYNRQLRACGYFPSPSSSHMSGSAVDIIVSPSRCKARFLRAYGFENVCPLYHHGHCHISQCGTPRTVQRAREATHERARQIRRDNRTRPAPVASAPIPQRRPSRPETSNILIQGFMFGGEAPGVER